MGRSADYLAYLASPRWQAMRARTFRLAGTPRCYCCSRPPTPSCPLDVHHRTYERLGHERPEDLILACRRCHDLIHQCRHLCADLAAATQRVRQAMSQPVEKRGKAIRKAQAPRRRHEWKAFTPPTSKNTNQAQFNHWVAQLRRNDVKRQPEAAP